MLIPLILVVHTLLAAALVAVILLQRSEGGGLGIGGGTGGGLVSARGAADLMTRLTTIFASCFVVTSLLLAILYGQEGKTRRIDANAATSAARILPDAPVPAPAPAPGGLGAIPFGAPPVGPAVPAPAPEPPANGVPLAK